MQPRPTSCAARLLGLTALWFVLVTLASCGRLPDAPAVGHPRPPGGVTGVAGDTTSGPAALACLEAGVTGQAIADADGGTLIGSVPELNLQLLRAPAGATLDAFVLRLQQDKRVIFAEPDYAVECAEARQSSYAFSEGMRDWSNVTDQSALTRIGVPQALQLARGAGVLVAILDTGVDLDHPALAGALSLPGIEPGVTVEPGDDRPESVDSNGDGVVDGALGHGTHVAGIVHAVAPGALLLPVRVLDSDGVGDVFRVARGLVLAVERGAEVANLSLGLPQASRSLEAAIDYAVAAGVVVTAAAGNADANGSEFPASYAPVVAVAGTDSTDHKAAFSDYGPGTDLAAPGTGILSTYWDGTFAVWSGTSVATPFVSGAAALAYGLVAGRSANAALQVQAAIVSGAVPLSGVDPVFGALLGAGRVDVAAALARMTAVSASSTDPGTVDRRSR